MRNQHVLPKLVHADPVVARHNVRQRRRPLRQRDNTSAYSDDGLLSGNVTEGVPFPRSGRTLSQSQGKDQDPAGDDGEDGGGSHGGHFEMLDSVFTDRHWPSFPQKSAKRQPSATAQSDPHTAQPRRPAAQPLRQTKHHLCRQDLSFPRTREPRNISRLTCIYRIAKVSPPQASSASAAPE